MARSVMQTSMAFARLPFDGETYLADVRMFQQEGFGAVYLIDDERKAIIETGTSWDAGRIRQAVKGFGLRPADIDALVVSHIHLDHAGGAGFLLDDMPRAKVYGHERGFKHLVEPTKLVASAHEALGPREAEAFGTMRPIPPDRLVSVKDQDRLDLGTHSLRFLDSPGHAPHELTILDEHNRCLYTGEAISAGIPGESDSGEHHGHGRVPCEVGACRDRSLTRRSKGSRRTTRAAPRASPGWPSRRWPWRHWRGRAERTRRRSPRSPGGSRRRNPRWRSSTTSSTCTPDYSRMDTNRWPSCGSSIRNSTRPASGSGRPSSRWPRNGRPS